ncbi:hypothetical protein P692DRAFT_20825949 [Suillus brevipes Sb2]|nr:hypothetical protein P692DRAFT_20825949 [Suillus brevipes Sb2]
MTCPTHFPSMLYQRLERQVSERRALYDVYQTLIAVCGVAAKMAITPGRLNVRCSNRYKFILNRWSHKERRLQRWELSALKHSQRPHRSNIACWHYSSTGFQSSVAIDGLMARLGQPIQHSNVVEDQKQPGYAET